MKPSSLLVILTSVFFVCDGAKILVFLPLNFPGESAPFDVLSIELKERGHELTYIMNENHGTEIPGVEIKLFGDYGNNAVETIELLKFNVTTRFWEESNMYNGYRKVCRYFYMDDNFSRISTLLKSTKFDAIIIGSQTFYQCWLPLVNSLDTPIIMMSSRSLNPDLAWSQKLYYPLSYVPMERSAYSSGFLDRKANLYNYFLGYLDNYSAIKAADVEVAGVSSNLSVADAAKKISLHLVNSHFTLEGVRPSAPNVVQVGCIHCRKGNPLPEPYAEFLNDTKSKGFVVVSLGSNFQGAQTPKNMITHLVNLFRLRKDKVIWAYNGNLQDLITDGSSVPQNIMHKTWIPQQDLIAHPKCRLLINGGGNLALQEAIYHGVPVFEIPLLFVSSQNAINAEKFQSVQTMGIDYAFTWRESIEKNISDLIDYPRYKQHFAKKLSEIMRDRPEEPVKTAAFWVEYVIRHQGAPQLLLKGKQLNFIQYFSIDVIVTLIAIILFFTTLLICFLNALWVRFSICSANWWYNYSEPKFVSRVVKRR